MSSMPRFRTAALALALPMFIVLPAVAQQYPAKPIRIIVPFGAGGSADTMARLTGQRFTESWGQPVLVENRTGAAGMIGAEAVARAAPDGYTLMLTSGAFSSTPALNPNVPVDVFKDFTPIVNVSNTATIINVHPSLPVKSVKELIAFAKQRPGQVGYATAGVGSTGHLATELFLSTTGTQMLHVPYKANPIAVIDVIAGHVPVMFDLVLTGAPHARAGKLRALAVTSSKRLALLPDVPTVTEAGLPAFDANVWLGIMGPAGLSRDIVMRVNAEVNRIVQLPDIVKRFNDLGVEPAGGTPEAFAALHKSDFAKWQRVVRDAKIKVE
ncbi:MAG: tripartite tricarboxylate transporter substrate binding protein [Proteobacteria bacterium]|nr:tripartite tricarboxylate transporter substrate binding protein [Burkholderiales bacterium]